MHYTSWGNRIFITLIVLLFVPVTLLGSFHTESMAPEWVKVSSVLGSFILVSLVVYNWTSKKIYEKETPEGRQEMEDWLASQGYRRFTGEVKFTNETVTYILGKKSEKFLLVGCEQDHNGYHYYDYGNYRIVRLANSEMQNIYFIK